MVRIEEKKTTPGGGLVIVTDSFCENLRNFLRKSGAKGPVQPLPGGAAGGPGAGGPAWGLII